LLTYLLTYKLISGNHVCLTEQEIELMLTRHEIASVLPPCESVYNVQ